MLGEFADVIVADELASWLAQLVLEPRGEGLPTRRGRTCRSSWRWVCDEPQGLVDAAQECGIYWPGPGSEMLLAGLVAA